MTSSLCAPFVRQCSSALPAAATWEANRHDSSDESGTKLAFSLLSFRILVVVVLLLRCSPSLLSRNNALNKNTHAALWASTAMAAEFMSCVSKAAQMLRRRGGRHWLMRMKRGGVDLEEKAFRARMGCLTTSRQGRPMWQFWQEKKSSESSNSRISSPSCPCETFQCLRLNTWHNRLPIIRLSLFVESLTFLQRQQRTFWQFCSL